MPIALLRPLLAALLLVCLPSLATAGKDNGTAMPSGWLPFDEYLRLVPGITTRDDVLALFGPPADEESVKRKKFFTDGGGHPANEAFLPCIQESADRINLWRYRVGAGGFDARKRRFDKEWWQSTYLAFDDNGLLCAAAQTTHR